MTDWRIAYDKMRRALEDLVYHDRAADNREGLPGCVELQWAEELLDEMPATTSELNRLAPPGIAPTQRLR